MKLDDRIGCSRRLVIKHAAGCAQEVKSASKPVTTPSTTPTPTPKPNPVLAPTP